MADSAQIFSVTQINTFIKELLERVPPLNNVSVKGEVSNLTKHRTGHYYFTLKDESSSIKTVMFRTDAEKVDFDLQNGQKVVAFGRVSVFVRDGGYQLYATEIKKEGIGSLYETYKALCEKLEKAGLFDRSHKKALPSVPFSLGIVTAPTGAAIRDMINISKRRFPLCKIILYPALVQGKSAADSIIRGIEYFNRQKNVQLVIIGRGGGSLEDLWAFNEEKLAYAVYNSDLPIISAVGHETDTVITDFVADLRAPTPSAAAELALPDKTELMQKFANVNKHNAVYLKRRLENEKKLLSMLSGSGVMTKPARMLDEKKQTLLNLDERLCRSAAAFLDAEHKKLASLDALLSSYNPLSVLKRGYSVAYDQNGSVIKSINGLESGDKFSLALSDGKIDAVTLGKTPDKEAL